MNKAASKPEANLKLSLITGSFALFFLSFLMSGNASAIPQIFLERVYPANKTFLLSVSLFLSTATAFGGVLISRRTKPRPFGVAIGLLITAVLAVGLFSAVTYIVFIGCLLIVQFADNFLLNQVDLASVSRAGPLRQFNDTAGITARLLAMLAAPVFFTALSGNRLLEQVVVGLVGLGAMAGSIRLSRAHVTGAETNELPDYLHAPDLVDWLVFGYAISVYAALYLFAANLIYLLRDLFHFQNSTIRGGLAVLTVFLMALIANAAVAAIRKRSPRLTERALRPGSLCASALVLILAAGLLLSGIRTSFTPVLVGCGLIGVTYGMFLWEIRDYSSSAARQGKAALLSWFNNMANVSSLLAFGLMLVMAAQRAQSPETYYLRLMWAIAVLPATGLIILFCAIMSSRQKPNTSEDVLDAV